MGFPPSVVIWTVGIRKFEGMALSCSGSMYGGLGGSTGSSGFSGSQPLSNSIVSPLEAQIRRYFRLR